MRRMLGLAVVFLAALAWAAPPGGQSSPQSGRREVATFAGGCFWSMQKAFDGVPGVISTTAGYSGGNTRNPTYEQVETGQTGHAESVEVVFDPAQISYAQLLDVYWHHIDPVAKDRQFCDSGNQYRSAIFFHDDAQRRLAEASKQKLEASGRFKDPVATALVPAGPFYPAEDYHQHYARKNPGSYQAYRLGCGRDQRLKEIWGAVPAH